MKSIPSASSENQLTQFVEQFINQTNQSIFLTGKAGTGKTTLLRKIKETTHKNVAIVAPTGIAALNASGVTIHSFFQLPFASFIPAFGVQPNFSDAVKFENKDSLRRHFTMNKTRILIENSASGQALSKKTIWNTEINCYKANKIAALQQQLQRVPTLLDEPQADFTNIFDHKTKKTVQKEKKSTYERTLELLQEGYSVEAIAKERQVSKQTIYNHFVVLIKAQQIALTDIMSQARIEELQSHFEDYHETSLGPLKEKLGAKVTWDELKVVQAYLQTQD